MTPNQESTEWKIKAVAPPIFCKDASPVFTLFLITLHYHVSYPVHISETIYFC